MLPFFLIYFHFAGHMHKNVLLLTKTIKTLVCAACSVSIRLWVSVKLCLCKHNHFLPDTHRQPTALQHNQEKPIKRLTALPSVFTVFPLESMSPLKEGVLLSAGRWGKFTYTHFHCDSRTRHTVPILSRGVLMVFVLNFERSDQRSVRSVRSV